MNFYTNFCSSGNNILLKEIVNGQKKRRRVEYKPTLYVKTDKKTDWKTLQGVPVAPIKFDSISEARDFVNTNGDVSNFDIYGNTQYQYACIAEIYPEPELKYDMGQISILTLDIEVESEFSFPKPENPTERINVITVKDFRHNVYHVFTFNDGGIYNDGNYYIPTPNVRHYSYDSEKEMLLGFIEFIRRQDPDVITGWNVRSYDLPYLFNRIELLFDEKTANKLSVWNIVHRETFHFMNRDIASVNIFGICILDYYQLYLKLSRTKQESNKLGFIAQVELGETKVDWESKYETMKEFYNKNFQMFVEYNIQDVALPDKLESKLKMLELVISVAYLTKVNYLDVLSQTRAWDSFIHYYLLSEHVVVPKKEVTEKKEQFAGAYVKEPIPGMYYWIVSFDLNSLYPNILKLCNIGVDTFIEKLNITPEDFLNQTEIFKNSIKHAKRNNYTLSANGALYSRENLGFMYKLVSKVVDGRNEAKGLMKKKEKILETLQDKESIESKTLKTEISSLSVKQESLKVMANSLYGCLGTPYFRHFDVVNAEAVTLTGQFIIQYLQKELNSLLDKVIKSDKPGDYCIASDTDSLYLTLNPLVRKVFGDGDLNIEKVIKFLDRVCIEKLLPEINRVLAEITESFTNGITPDVPILGMKRETIADRGIWTAKKHYILNVHDSEGIRYKIPKLKIMGMEMVKSSMPQFTRKKMKDSVQIIMNSTNDELAEFVENTRKEFMALPVEAVACPKSVNGLEKYGGDSDEIYIKGTPLHVKAVLVFNDLVTKNNLHLKYPTISDADKIKYLYLKVPNPSGDKVIAFTRVLPPELNLHKFVDYEAMYNLTFVSPLKKILDAIGWTIEKPYDMDRFFV